MSFKAVFIAITLAGALVVSAFLLHRARPAGELDQPTAALVRASGKCAECHRRETAAIVEEYELSAHAGAEINCLDCHRALDGQEAVDHRGFTIAVALTSRNCAQCHAEEHDQYLRSRHAAPAWAAVAGAADFTETQVAFAETFHPGAVDRPANTLAALEGPAAIASGCTPCHDIGRPNEDGSIGSCTECHARHAASVGLARTPRTCGQCHLGPDHSQIEIYEESKHGVLYVAQRDRMNLDAPPESLTPSDMPVPTCATCHMSGLGGLDVTHDTTERLSYFLFAEVSERREDYARRQARMKRLCGQCHTRQHTDRFYALAEATLEATNEKVRAASEIIDEMRAAGSLTPEPFDEPAEFVYFDLWHYYGRTAKHGAFMGGADYVQWHGNYELLYKTVELRALADEARRAPP